MLTHKGTQIIKTPRLTLRRFSVEDCAAMYTNWASDEEVTKYLTWAPHENEEETRRILSMWSAEYEKDDYYQWAIVLDEIAQPIGSIAAVDINDKVGKAHIGYCIGKRWWHQGITSEALAAVISFLFNEVGVQRIEARHDPRNPHSGGVMRKCGMQYEGTMRCADRNRQGICDAAWYGILKEEYDMTQKGVENCDKTH